MVTVAVLGHRGMLGRSVARWLREHDVEVITTDLRYDGTDAVPRWAAQADYTVDCILDAATDPTRDRHLGEHVARLIVPSTDAIRETSEYARGKQLMEATARAVIIRSGIVDIHRQPAFAYTDWLCDPLTPLEWVEGAWSLRDEAPRVFDRGRHVVDRWTLAMHVARIWQHPPPVAAEGGRRDRVVVGQGGPWVGDALEDYAAWLSRS